MPSRVTPLSYRLRGRIIVDQRPDADGLNGGMAWNTHGMRWIWGAIDTTET
ncbi:MAG: hypothetical protein WC934_06995 [Acidithiobacillus sp.]|jgi:hypothetical protein